MSEPKLDVDYVNGMVILGTSYTNEYLEHVSTNKIKLVELLKMLASKTDNKLDDEAVTFLSSILK